MSNDDIPKICQGCPDMPYATEDDPFPDCGRDPQECSLQKARYMKKIYAESRATGARVEDLVERDCEAEEAAIVKQMGDMADFFLRMGPSACASSKPRP